MDPRVVVLKVAVALDPIPGVFHTPESAQESVQRILDSSIGHYNPVVLLSRHE